MFAIIPPIFNINTVSKDAVFNSYWLLNASLRKIYCVPLRFLMLFGFLPSFDLFKL